MKVLIVSDTHGRDENLEHVVMNEAPFDMFVHCGDVEGRDTTSVACGSETVVLSVVCAGVLEGSAITFL